MVAGWVLYRHYVYPHAFERVLGWGALARSLWVVELVSGLMLSVPYAVALVLWGRNAARSLGAGSVAVLAGVYLATVEYVFARYVVGHHGEALGVTSARVFDWLTLLGPAVLVPLAWGVARRTGVAWLVGLPVGPAVAAVLWELRLHSPWWQQHVVFDQHAYHWVVQAVVYVAPFVAAALACWAVDVRSSA